MNPANIHLFKINNKSTKKSRSDVFIVNFEHVLHFFLRFLSLTLNKQMLAGKQSGIIYEYSLANNYLHKVNDRNTNASYEIYSKATIKTSKQHL